MAQQKPTRKMTAAEAAAASKKNPGTISQAKTEGDWVKRTAENRLSAEAVTNSRKAKGQYVTPTESRDNETTRTLRHMGNITTPPYPSKSKPTPKKAR